MRLWHSITTSNITPPMTHEHDEVGAYGEGEGATSRARQKAGRRVSGRHNNAADSKI